MDKKRVVSVDFETYYKRSGVDAYSIKGLGNWAYVHHELFDAYMISVSDGEEVWAGHPDDFEWESLRGCRIVSHNAAFDRSVYLRLVELGKAPPGLEEDWRCTADLSVYVCNRRSLKDAAEFLLKVKLAKDVRDRASGKHWADMVKEGWADSMLKYAERDAIYCWRLWNEFSDRWPEHEMRLSDLNIRKGWRGVGVNGPLVDSYLEILNVALHNTEAALPWVVRGEAKPTSTKAIAEECRKEGIPCPPVKSGDEEDGDGEEAFDAWEAKYSEIYPWVGHISSWRKINKALKKFMLVKTRLRPEGTMGFSLKYGGSHTLRFSGDAGFNMQNLRNTPMFFDGWQLIRNEDRAEELNDLLHDGKPLPEGYVAVDERKILQPTDPEKMEFCLSDLSQIEPRVLNWLAGNTELLDKIRAGMPIYEAHARDSMGWAGGSLKKENPRRYKLAKARILGLGYGCGVDKFVVVAWTLARLRITLEESTENVADFREKNPLLADKEFGLWRKLDEALWSAAAKGEDLVLELPSGRSMRYEKVRRERRIEPDEDGKPRSRSVVTAIVNGRRVITYGAKLAENITQAVARDVFVGHILALDDAGIDFVWSIHDEAVNQVPKGFDKHIIESIMSVCPSWLEGCPIAAEASIAPHYKK